MTAAIIWLVVGILLILSELLATSIVAVFLGTGALATAFSIQAGLIDSQAEQFLVFGIVSLVSLVVARKHCKRWLVGYTANRAEGQSQFQRDIGERVIVLADFHQGAGRVTLNGVAWNARSDETLKTGEVAWVIANEGIRLVVSREKQSGFPAREA